MAIFKKRESPFRHLFQPARHFGYPWIFKLFKAFLKRGVVLRCVEMIVYISISWELRWYERSHVFSTVFVRCFILLMEKSCTKRYGKYPIIHRVSYMSGGAGFLPSTVYIYIYQLVDLWNIKHMGVSLKLANHQTAVSKRNGSGSLVFFWHQFLLLFLGQSLAMILKPHPNNLIIWSLLGNIPVSPVSDTIIGPQKWTFRY